MVPHERSATEVLRNAIAMEIEGRDFFEQASRRMKRPRSRDMFLSLATQEKKHIDVLGSQLSMLESGRGWGRLDDLKRDRTDPSKSVFSDLEIRKADIDAGSGELEVIDLGIEVEKKSIEYYRDAGRASSDANAKRVFNWLVGEEAGHLTILKAERDSRSRSGFYYDQMEFSLETQ